MHQKLKAEISDVDKDDLVFKLKISPLPVDNLDDKSAVGSLRLSAAWTASLE